MMTQNCVTHMAISKAAEKYSVTILPDCCTTVDEMIHNIALHAVSTRVKFGSFKRGTVIDPLSEVSVTTMLADDDMSPFDVGFQLNDTEIKKESSTRL